MGAHSITRFVATDDSYILAFDRVVDDDRFEHGSDPYSGTFATCSGVALAGKPMWRIDAETAADAVFLEAPLPARLAGLVLPGMRAVKRGPALAIPVLDPAQARRKRRTLTLSVDHLGPVGRSALMALAYDKIVVPDGGFLDALHVEDDTVKCRTVVRRAVGPARTVYHVYNDRGVRAEPNVDHPTERAAITAARQIAADAAAHGMLFDGRSMEVRATRMRGAAPTTVGVELVKRSVKVTVDVCTPVGTPTTHGWFFFALAAS